MAGIAPKTATRQPTTIRKDGTILVATQVPLTQRHFVGEQVKDPEDMARQLNQLQADIHAATLATRSQPYNQATTYEGKLFGQSGLAGNVSFVHNLGRPARWKVVRWYNSVNAADPHEVSNDDTTLVLAMTTGNVGIADVEVW